MFKVGDYVRYIGVEGFLRGKFGRIVCFGPHERNGKFFGVVFEDFNHGHHNYGLDGHTVNSGYFVRSEELIIKQIDLENK